MMNLSALLRLAAMLAGLSLGGSCFGYVSNGYNYMLTAGTYGPTSNWSEGVALEFGPTAHVVDWNTIKSEFGGSIASVSSFLDGLGISSVYQSPGLTWNGSLTWGGTTRTYGVNRAEGTVPAGYLVHDQILDNYLLLGSWYGDRQLIVAVPVPEPSDVSLLAIGLALVPGMIRRLRSGKGSATDEIRLAKQQARTNINEP